MEPLSWLVQQLLATALLQAALMALELLILSKYSTSQKNTTILQNKSLYIKLHKGLQQEQHILGLDGEAILQGTQQGAEEVPGTKTSLANYWRGK